MNWGAVFFTILGVGLVGSCFSIVAMVFDPAPGGFVEKALPWAFTIGVICLFAAMFIGMLGQAGVIQ